MLKQSPSRNLRSKGFKVKHCLQICLVLAICIWLLYQVKQSYGKKAPMEDSSRQRTKEVRSGHEILKLGRKDLNPELEEIAAEFEKHGDDEEELEQEDEENKLRENEGERRGGGDDEIDGHDQDKAQEEEPEQLEDLIDEDDKEEEGSEGKEHVETNNYIEDVHLLNNQDHIRFGRNTEKAPEEHYEGADAANVVIHNTQLQTTEEENEVLRAVKEEEPVKNAAKNELEGRNKTSSTMKNNDVINDSNAEVAESGAADRIRSVKSVGSKEKVDDFTLNNLDESLHLNSSTAVDIDRNNSTMQTVVLEQNEFHNETATKDQSDFSMTLSTSSILLTQNADTVDIADSNTNARAEGTEETLGLSTRRGNLDYLQNEHIDEVLYQEDKEDHIDLESLLATKVEESNSENAM